MSDVCGSTSAHTEAPIAPGCRGRLDDDRFTERDAIEQRSYVLRGPVGGVGHVGDLLGFQPGRQDDDVDACG